jgi:hypothetical protein
MLFLFFVFPVASGHHLARARPPCGHHRSPCIPCCNPSCCAACLSPLGFAAPVHESWCGGMWGEETRACGPGAQVQGQGVGARWPCPQVVTVVATLGCLSSRCHLAPPPLSPPMASVACTCWGVWGRCCIWCGRVPVLSGGACGGSARQKCEECCSPSPTHVALVPGSSFSRPHPLLVAPTPLPPASLYSTPARV